jgi:hypothetical protein
LAYFALPDTFLAVLRASGSFSCFAHPFSFSTVPRASGLGFMFCAPGIFLCGTEAVEARFQVLRSQTRFWRYRGRRVPFSCFALPDTFSKVPKLSGVDFMFYAPEFISGGTKGVEYHFQVLHSRTRFRRYRGRRGSFLCFPLPDSFWAVPRPPGPVFMFCALEFVSGGTEDLRSRWHILRS